MMICTDCVHWKRWRRVCGFSWKYDTQSGKSILREYCIDDLQYEYTDLVVAENSLYGKYENIARYAYVTKAADDSLILHMIMRQAKRAG